MTDESSLLSQIAADVREIKMALGISLSSNLKADTTAGITGITTTSTSIASTAREPGAQTLAGQAWTAYSAAYRERYGVNPVRNAKVNASLVQLVARIGGDAPYVAAFYVRHDDPFYVKRCHQVGCLLADAEKLRTEWATKRKPVAVKTFQMQADEGAKARADAAAERAKQQTQALLQKQSSTPRTQPESAKERLAKLMEGIGQ